MDIGSKRKTKSQKGQEEQKTSNIHKLIKGRLIAIL